MIRRAFRSAILLSGCNPGFGWTWDADDPQKGCPAVINSAIVSMSYVKQTERLAQRRFLRKGLPGRTSAPRI
jgi:hypothetical protein